MSGPVWTPDQLGGADFRRAEREAIAVEAYWRRVGCDVTAQIVVVDLRPYGPAYGVRAGLVNGLPSEIIALGWAILEAEGMTP